MLLEMGVGDAYGLGFEFGPPELFQHNSLSGLVKNVEEYELLKAMDVRLQQRIDNLRMNAPIMFV